MKAADAAHETQRVFAEFRKILSPEFAHRVGTISYEDIARIARRFGQGKLADWIDARLPAGIAVR